MRKSKSQNVTCKNKIRASAIVRNKDGLLEERKATIKREF
jgi:hypothetical protein